MRAQWFWRTVAGYKAAQFAAWRFHGHKSLAGRRRKPFRKNLEMIDERFHLGLHLFARWRHDARRVRPDWPLMADLRHRLAGNLQTFPHLGDADHVPPETIGIGARRDVKFEFFVAGIGEKFAVVI